MGEWTPATKEEVKRAVRLEQEATDAACWQERAHMLVHPYPCTIERFGGVEPAFVVAKAAGRVVYFDDVEGIFGTATDVDGRLVDAAHYSSLAAALKEASSGG